jgi:YfiH family protein
MEIFYLTVAEWAARDGLVHGFAGRRGGRSGGVYAGLNCSFRVGDDPQLVKENLCDLKKAAGLHDLKIVTMRQVHGDTIRDIEDDNLKEAGEADGMAACRPGIFLGVLTADCVPILFAARDPKAVAVVHAGWRGTLAGLAPKMVEHLRRRYGVEPASLEVALGPAIGPCCYEVGSDVLEPMNRRWGEAVAGSTTFRNGKRFLDLKALNASQLAGAGVPRGQLFAVGPCTACSPGDFYSYRRQRGETGRQLSFIGWLH